MKDVVVEYTKGKGPGGQRKNKVETAVRLTHIPTGIKVFVDGREREKNKKAAFKLLQTKLGNHRRKLQAQRKKEARDKKIHEHGHIRTYDFSRGVVIDHRTKKEAPLKQVLRKGKIGLLR